MSKQSTQKPITVAAWKFWGTVSVLFCKHFLKIDKQYKKVMTLKILGWSYSRKRTRTSSDSPPRWAAVNNRHSPTLQKPSSCKAETTPALWYIHLWSRKQQPPSRPAVLDKSAACRACKGLHNWYNKVQEWLMTACTLMLYTASTHRVLWNWCLEVFVATANTLAHRISRQWSVRSTLCLERCLEREERSRGWCQTDPVE